MALNATKFKKPTTTAAGKPPLKRGSKYKGIKSATPRDPMPFPGVYRFRVCEVEAGYNPGKGTDSHKVKLEVVEIFEDHGQAHHAVGDVVLAMWLTSGKSMQASLPRVKAFTMNAAGYETDEEYDVFDPEGEFIDSTTGTANAYTEAELSIIGRLVDCQVTRGNATPDGTDFYREYNWGVVEDKEQDQVLKVGA